MPIPENTEVSRPFSTAPRQHRRRGGGNIVRSRDQGRLLWKCPLETTGPMHSPVLSGSTGSSQSETSQDSGSSTLQGGRLLAGPGSGGQSYTLALKGGMKLGGEQEKGKIGRSWRESSGLILSKQTKPKHYIHVWNSQRLKVKEYQTKIHLVGYIHIIKNTVI